MWVVVWIFDRCNKHSQHFTPFNQFESNGYVSCV
jgi:hypothetical protein